MYQHLTPMEWGVIAAHIYGYQHQNVPVFKDDETRTKVGSRMEPLTTSIHFDTSRPYSQLERIQIALRTLWVDKKVRFENGLFHPAQMILTSTRSMDVKREEESKKIFQAIYNWNEPILQDCLKKFGFVSEKLGFGRTAASAFVGEHTLGDLEALFRAGAENTAPVVADEKTEEELQAEATLKEDQEKEKKALQAKEKKDALAKDKKEKVEANKLAKTAGA